MSWYDYIIDFISAFLSFYIEILMFYKLSDSKMEKNIKNFIIILVSVIMLILNAAYVDTLPRSFMCMIIAYVSFLLLSKKPVLDCFIYSMFGILFVAFYEIILSGIFMFFDIITMEMVDSNHITKGLFSIAIALLPYFTFYITPIRRFVNKIVNHKKKWISTITTISLIAFCFSLVIMNFNYSETFSLKLYIGNILLIICLSIIIAISIYNYVIVEKEEQKTEILLDFMKKYEKVIEENRINNHELLNNLVILKNLDNKNTKEFENIIDQMIDSYTNKGIRIKNIHSLPSGLKGMIYYKLYGLEEENYEVNINVSKLASKRIKNIDYNDYISLNKIIGIVLDNAIEASNKTKNKYIVVDIYTEKGKVVIDIANSYKGKVDINNINKKGYSTKGKNRGLGLYIMNKILKSSDNISIYQDTDNNNHIFNTKIIINKK